MAQLSEAAVDVVEPTDSATVEDQTTTETQQQDDAAREPADAEMYPDDAPDGEEGEQGGEDEQTEVNDGLPQIQAPRSLKAEEKEAFAKLPREAQEFVSRRLNEVDRFAETKAAEAQNARAMVEREALTTIETLQRTYAQVVEQYAAPFVPEPDPVLQLEDPEAYVYQLKAHRQSLAQRQQAQQHVGMLQQQAQETQRQIAAIEAQQTEAVLKEKFPEYLDPQTGPKLREELGSIAVALGYPPEALNQVDATDILAMREIATMKAKADRWDALQKDKMSAVRAAKNLPRLSRPGASTGARPQTDDPAKLLYPND